MHFKWLLYLLKEISYVHVAPVIAMSRFRLRKKNKKKNTFGNDKSCLP